MALCWELSCHFSWHLCYDWSWGFGWVFGWELLWDLSWHFLGTSFVTLLGLCWDFSWDFGHCANCRMNPDSPVMLVTRPFLHYISVLLQYALMYDVIMLVWCDSRTGIVMFSPHGQREQGLIVLRWLQRCEKLPHYLHFFTTDLATWLMNINDVRTFFKTYTIGQNV